MMQKKHSTNRIQNLTHKIIAMFNKKFAQQYIDKLMKKHKIIAYKQSVTSSGHAMVKSRKIKIPAPTNVDRFAVCLHEIAHVIKKKGSKSFEKEFYCDKYALDILIELGYETDKWIARMKWHVLSRIAMAHNRGLSHDKINSEIREFFRDIDFTQWVGRKVYVGHVYWENPIPENVKLTKAMSAAEVEASLKEKGLSLRKSDIDDSTYRHYVVWSDTDPNHGSPAFANLSEVIDHYKL